MKKIFVLALLLLAFNAKSQTKYETEKWLAEKLYAFRYTYTYSGISTLKVEVCNCEIKVTHIQQSPTESCIGIERIPITSLLTSMGGGVYEFRGNISIKWETKNQAEITTSLYRLVVPDDMLERIKKALEHYKNLCGVDEPF